MNFVFITCSFWRVQVTNILLGQLNQQTSENSWNGLSSPWVFCGCETLIASSLRRLFTLCLYKVKIPNADHQALPPSPQSLLPAAVFTRSPTSTFPNLHANYVLFLPHFLSLAKLKPTCSQESRLNDLIWACCSTHKHEPHLLSHLTHMWPRQVTVPKSQPSLSNQW